MTHQCRNESDQARFEALWAQVAQPTFQAEPDSIIYQGRNTLHVDDQDAVKWVVKRWHGTHTKAQKSYQAAEALLRHHIDTPAPIGYAEDATTGISMYVCAYAEAVQIRVLHGSEWDRDNSPLNERARNERHQVLQAVGHMAAKLHENSLLHKDFTAGNILLQQQHEWIPSLIDLNRMAYGRVNLKQGIKSLVQLELQADSDINALLTPYAERRKANCAKLRDCYHAALRWHLLKFSMKNKTRSLRRALNPFR